MVASGAPALSTFEKFIAGLGGYTIGVPVLFEGGIAIVCIIGGVLMNLQPQIVAVEWMSRSLYTLFGVLLLASIPWGIKVNAKALALSAILLFLAAIYCFVFRSELFGQLGSVSLGVIILIVAVCRGWLVFLLQSNRLSPGDVRPAS